MRGKLVLVAGLAVGYVLGSRAGRKRYDQIAKAAGTVWHSAPVQRQVENIEDFAKAKAPDVVDFISGRVKKVVTKSVSAKPAARKPATRKPPTTPATPSPAE